VVSDATLIVVSVRREPIETITLDVLHRGQPVTKDTVAQWFADRSKHTAGCPCWRCEAAAKVTPHQVFLQARAWRRGAANSV
jgi:hypothetical protein